MAVGFEALEEAEAFHDIVSGFIDKQRAKAGLQPRQRSAAQPASEVPPRHSVTPLDSADGEALRTPLVRDSQSTFDVSVMLRYKCGILVYV